MDILKKIHNYLEKRKHEKLKKSNLKSKRLKISYIEKKMNLVEFIVNL